MRSVRFLLRSDSQSPSNCTLSRRVLGVFVQRKWSGGVGNYFTSAPAASIDAGPDRRFSGLVLLVELRTDADFYVVATLEERHGSPSVVDELKNFATRSGWKTSALTVGRGSPRRSQPGGSAVACRQRWDSAQMICTTETQKLYRRPSTLRPGSSDAITIDVEATAPAGAGARLLRIWRSSDTASPMTRDCTWQSSIAQALRWPCCGGRSRSLKPLRSSLRHCVSKDCALPAPRQHFRIGRQPFHQSHNGSRLWLRSLRPMLDS